MQRWGARAAASPLSLAVLALVALQSFGARATHLQPEVDMEGDAGRLVRVQAGPWGPCRPRGAGGGGGGGGTAQALRRLTFEPLVGEQTRNLTCDGLTCQHGGEKCCSQAGVAVETIRMCIVPEDCVVSEWSEWRASSRCGAPPGPTNGPLAKPSPCLRTRTVISLPQGDGKPCGPLEEHNASCAEWAERHPLQEAVRWLPAPWGPCRVQQPPSVYPNLSLPLALSLSSSRTGGENSGGRCGGGLQRRVASCQDRLRRVLLPDTACAHLPPPLTVQRCEVPCPRDCVVGAWGSWGPCEPLSGCPMTPVEEITATGFRRRVRRVVVAGSAGGAPCGALAEVQPCGAAACARWAPGPWSACRLQPTLSSQGQFSSLGPAHCGPGRRERRVYCHDLHGGELSEEQCLGAGPRPSSTEDCRVACPRDCVVSPWGPWTPCSRPCSSRHHKGYRTRNRTIVAPPGEDGERCPPDSAIEQREDCNPHGCLGYSWLSLPWQPCTARPTNKRAISTRSRPLQGEPLVDDAMEQEQEQEEGEVEGGGADRDQEQEVDREEVAEQEQGVVPGRDPCGPEAVQSREVWCMENSDRRVPDSHCSPLRKPETWRTCERPCARPCVLSPWSEWTACPQDCEGGIQERERYLESGWEQAEQCGALRERRSCPTLGAALGAGAGAGAGNRSIPHWAHGAWSTCQLAEGRICGDGIMTRGVWCSLQHHKVGVGLCSGPPPASALRCSVECHSRCQLSDWSAWLPCTEPCGKMVTRFRKKLGEAPCPNTVLYEAHECPCQGFDAQLAGAWSSCIAEGAEPNNGASGAIINGGGQCGAGWRYRRVLCEDLAGRLVEPHWCRDHLRGLVRSGEMTGLVREPCTVPCEIDCHTSQWSAWGECILSGGTSCGTGLQLRTRNILVNSSLEGRPCGETLQSKVCSKPCEQYGWEVGGWSACQLIPRHRTRGCGTGDQARAVRCIELSSGDTVADALCDPVGQPADLNACHVPCPGECVLSDWSDWSQCPKPCTHRAQRDRTRALLRAGVPGQRCPPLIEAQSCLLNRTCFHYHWHIAPWGACLPLGGSPCGEGMQQRAIYCERSDGRQVNTTFCDSFSRPVEPTEQFCYVDCPIDCELSPWGPWDMSRCVCGPGPLSGEAHMTRTRRSLTPASPLGRPCPRLLRQRVPCPLRPCYVIRGLEFSECQLDKGVSCGYGSRSRNVTCVRETDGEPVPLVQCGLQPSSWQDLYQEQPCRVPCAAQCRSSPWSRWSPCDGDVRSRSRTLYTPEGPPCTPDTKEEEVFEYGSCNGSAIRLEVDITKWRPRSAGPAHPSPLPSIAPDLDAPLEPEIPSVPDDYYVQTDEQIQKTYIITGEQSGAEHTTLAVGVASAALTTMLLLIYLTVRCHKQRTIHKV